MNKKVIYKHCRNCSYCKVSKGLSSKVYQCRLKDNCRVKPNGMCKNYKEVLQW